MYDRKYMFTHIVSDKKKNPGLSEFTSILICVLLHFALLHFALMSTQNVITQNVIYRGLLHFGSLNYVVVYTVLN